VLGKTSEEGGAMGREQQTAKGSSSSPIYWFKADLINSGRDPSAQC
jgi:hypothetical protein